MAAAFVYFRDFTCMPAIGFFEWMTDGAADLSLTGLMQFTQLLRIEVPGHPTSEVCGFSSQQEKSKTIRARSRMVPQPYFMHVSTLLSSGSGYLVYDGLTSIRGFRLSGGR